MPLYILLHFLLLSRKKYKGRALLPGSLFPFSPFSGDCNEPSAAIFLPLLHLFAFCRIDVSQGKSPTRTVAQLVDRVHYLVFCRTKVLRREGLVLPVISAQNIIIKWLPGTCASEAILCERLSARTLLAKKPSIRGPRRIEDSLRWATGFSTKK